MDVRYHAVSNEGRRYNHNEDFFLLPKEKGVFTTSNCPKVFVLCDGMGGANAGEVASKLTAQWFSEAMHNYLSSELEMITDLKLDIESERKVLSEAIVELINSVNGQLVQHANRASEFEGMGTTFISAIFLRGYVFVHSVGDSRCYLYSGGELQQLTEDQSVVWELYKKGVLSKDTLRHHPRKNLITMSIGNHQRLIVNEYSYKLEVDDLILLCTDGLSDMLSDEEIAQTLRSTATVSSVVDSLIAKALAAGGFDNITAMLIRILQLNQQS